MTLVNQRILLSNRGIDVTVAIARCCNRGAGARLVAALRGGRITASSGRVDESL